MSRSKKYIPIILIFIALNVFAHPFYVSITTIDYHSNKKRIEVSCRIFHDDLEHVLKENTRNKINIIKPQDKILIDSAISQYIQKKISIQVNGQDKKMKYIGYEIQQDVAWCYLEIPQYEAVKSLKITNGLLYEAFKTQANIMHISVNDNRKSTKLDNPTTTAFFEFK
ncbi:MAG: DUF6702 family protein [Sphingobacterium sp.]